MSLSAKLDSSPFTHQTRISLRILSEPAAPTKTLAIGLLGLRPASYDLLTCACRCCRRQSSDSLMAQSLYLAVSDPRFTGLNAVCSEFYAYSNRPGVRFPGIAAAVSPTYRDYRQSEKHMSIRSTRPSPTLIHYHEISYLPSNASA